MTRMLELAGGCTVQDAVEYYIADSGKLMREIAHSSFAESLPLLPLLLVREQTQGSCSAALVARVCLCVCCPSIT